MRYRQTHVSRFSAAAERLSADGVWHAFAREQRAWYRVHGRVLQQVRLDDGERDDFIGVFDAIAPLPPKLLRGGYRQEIEIRVRDDRFVVTGMLLKAYDGWELLAAAAGRHGFSMAMVGNGTLSCEIEVDSWSGAQFHRAVAFASTVGIVAAQLREDAAMRIPYAREEVTRLLETAYAVTLEACPPPDAVPAPRNASQTTLFPEA